MQQFQLDNLRKSHGASLLYRMTSGGLFVFPTNAEEWNHNEIKLLEMNENNSVALTQAQATRQKVCRKFQGVPQSHTAAKPDTTRNWKKDKN